MKRSLFCLVLALCAVSLAYADQTIRSLQQTLKDKGFYYGTVTGDKSSETTAAIRRYQIRNGLQVTGDINEETLRSLNASSNSVAGTSKTNSTPTVVHADNGRPDVDAPLVQSLPAPLSLGQPDRTLEPSPSYSTSYYQSSPFRVNRRSIAAAQYRLISGGYYRGRVDGNYGRQMAFAVRAFQSSAGLAPTGRLDPETLRALGASDADFAYLAPASRGYETWMPVRKFKHGKWKMKWKRSYRPFDGEDRDEDRQANTEPGSNPYNEE